MYIYNLYTFIYIYMYTFTYIYIHLMYIYIHLYPAEPNHKPGNPCWMICETNTLKRVEEHWKAKSVEKRKNMASIEQRWKALKSIEQHWKALNRVQKSWKALNSIEKRWTAFKKVEKRWTELKGREKRWKGVEKQWKALNSVEKQWTGLNSVEQRSKRLKSVALNSGKQSWKALNSVRKGWKALRCWKVLKSVEKGLKSIEKRWTMLKSIAEQSCRIALEQYFVTLFRPRIIRIMSHSISVHEPSYVHPHSDESNGEAMRRKGESHGSTGSSNPSNREHVLGHATCTWTDALHKLQIVHIFSASSMLVYWCVLCQRSRES